MKFTCVWSVVAILSFALSGCGDRKDREVDRQNNADVITTRKLCIVDERGNTRIALEMMEGFPSIRLLDEHGKGRLHILACGGDSQHCIQSAGVKIISEDQQTVIWLGLENVAPSLKLYYEEGDARIGLGVNPGGEPVFWLGTPDGAQHMVLEAAADGSPSMKLNSAE